MGTKIKVLAGPVPSGGSRRDSVPLSFLEAPYSSTCGPASIFRSLSSSGTHAPASFEDACDDP